MNISNISVSRSEVWKECSQRYKFQYHLKLIPEEPEPPYFLYGTFVHSIAESYVENKGKTSLQEIANSFLKGEIPIEERNGVKVFASKFPAEYMKRLPKHLKSIQELTDQIGFDGQTELEFELDLDPPNKKYIKGVIDRLIKKEINNEIHYWILDYKTSKTGRWMKKRVDRDLQLRCYAMVVRKLFNVPAKNIKAGLVYLETGKPIGAVFSDNLLDETERYMLEMYNEIVDTPPDKAWGNVGDHCKRCNYRKICPFYKIT